MSQATAMLALSLAASALLFAAPSAAGAPVDDATRAAARSIAEEALARFDRGDHQGALTLFDKADALVQAPTMGIMAARCLEKLGRWVEATERYLAVSRAPLDAGANEAQRNAVKAAEVERDALLPKIPALVVVVEGEGARPVEVTIDGKSVPAALLGMKRPTDPGRHRIEARRGSESVTREVVLDPGASVTVNLRLGSGGSAVMPPGPPAPPPADSRSSGSAMRGVGFAFIGLGGAGIVTGAILGGLAISARGNLDESGCKEGMCPRTVEDDVSRYNTLRLASGGALIAGLVVAAGGVTLAVLAPSGPKPASEARWEPWVGPGTAGVRGVFW